MPEDRAWRILRVFPDISESLIIHFMEISPTGKARLENAARSVARTPGGNAVTWPEDSIFSPKFSVADFEPINQTDQSRRTTRSGSPYRNSLAYRVQACVTPRTLLLWTERDVSRPACFVSIPCDSRGWWWSTRGWACFMRRVLYGDGWQQRRWRRRRWLVDWIKITEYVAYKVSEKQTEMMNYRGNKRG